MNTEQITITVDQEAAKTYRDATPAERRKLDRVLNLRLKHAAEPKQSLSELMTEIGEEAARRGLTPEILADILKDI